MKYLGVRKYYYNVHRWLLDRQISLSLASRVLVVFEVVD